MTIFISYARVDEGIALAIDQSLIDEGFETFLDIRDLNGKPDFQKAIEEAIQQCEGFIFLVSTDSLNKNPNSGKYGSYPITELQLVKEKWPSPGEHVLPVLLSEDIKWNERFRNYLESAGIFTTAGANIAAGVREEARERWLPKKGTPESLFIKIENYQDNSNGEPYRALDHFGPNDSGFFCGREGFVKTKLLRRINAKHDAIVILGASGVGKSSVVLAGLVPELYKQFFEDKGERVWRFTYFRPDEKDLYRELANTLFPFYKKTAQADKEIPIEEFASKFRGENGEKEAKIIFQKILRSHEKNNFLIIADQFEEFFRTQSENDRLKNNGFTKDNRESFLKLLLNSIEFANSNSLSNRFVLVVTIQETENAIKSGLFAEKLGSYFETLWPLNNDDIERVIRVPGVTIDPDVIDRIRKEFDGTKSRVSLPLLQYFLWYLWDTNGRKSITFDAYKNSKGVKETLADVAEKACKSLIADGENEDDIKKLFFGLVNVSTQDGITLRARFRNELGEAAWRIAEKLAKDTRLIVIYKNNNSEMAEIAHEALIINWPRLTEWLKVHKANLQLIDKIEERKKQWSNQRSGVLERLLNSRAHLFRGDELDKAIEYSRKPNPLLPELSNKAKAFVNTGRRHRWIVRFLIALFFPSLFGIPVYLYMENENNEKDLETATLEAKLDEQRIQLKKEAENRLSRGEKVFIETYFKKRHGAWLFGEREYKKAIEKFDSASKCVADSTSKCVTDDPETRIYINNAKIRLRGDDSLIIAVNVPIQKSMGVAQEILRGIAQAQEEVNKKLQECRDTKEDLYCNHSLSKPLEIIIGSDDNDESIARNIAEYLVNDRDVLAVVGHNASDVSMAASEKYQGKLLMISPTSFALDHDKIMQPEGKNYIYTMAGGINAMIYNIKNYIIQEGGKEKPRVLLCYDSRAMDQVIFKNSFKNWGNEDEIWASPIDCDFSKPSKGIYEILDEAKRDEVNHLFLGPHVNTIGDSFYLAQENAKRPKKLKLIASPTLYTAETLKNGKELDGLILGTYWHPNIPNEESCAFYKEAEKKWKENGVTWRTAFAYDAVKVIVEGMKKIHFDGSSDRERLLEAITGNSLKKGVTGEIIFDKKNGMRLKQQFHFMKISKNSESSDYEFVLINADENNQSACSHLNNS